MCMDITADQGTPFTLADQAALIFEDKNCGPSGTTEIYIIAKNQVGYRIIIESSLPYRFIKKQVEYILATLEFT